MNCGEDTDCSAGFAGALLGVVMGNGGIPEKWSEVLAGVINTGCIDLSEWGFFLPKTVEELTDRILADIPAFLPPDLLSAPAVHFEKEEIYRVFIDDEKGFFCPPYEEYGKYLWRNRSGKRLDVNELLRMPEYCEYKEFPVFKAVLEYQRAPYIKQGETFGFVLRLMNNGLSRSQHWADIRIFTGSGLKADCNSFTVPLQNTYRYEAVQAFSVELMENHACLEDIIVEISLPGRHTYGVLKATLSVADARDVSGE